MSSKEDPAEPFKFDEETLYPMEYLRTRLCGVVDLCTLLERLELQNNRVFRDALWGWEVLDAARQAFPYAAKPAAIIDSQELGKDSAVHFERFTPADARARGNKIQGRRGKP